MDVVTEQKTHAGGRLVYAASPAPESHFARPAICEWWIAPPKVVQQRCIWVDGHSAVIAGLCRGARVLWHAVRASVRAVDRVLCAIVLALIWLYQHAISPCLPGRCRFVPSCSSYTAQSLRQDGLFVGLRKGIWRLLRCHPFCAGGYDPP